MRTTARREYSLYMQDYKKYSQYGYCIRGKERRPVESRSSPKNIFFFSFGFCIATRVRFELPPPACTGYLPGSSRYEQGMIR